MYTSSGNCSESAYLTDLRSVEGVQVGLYILHNILYLNTTMEVMTRPVLMRSINIQQWLEGETRASNTGDPMTLVDSHHGYKWFVEKKGQVLIRTIVKE